MARWKLMAPHYLNSPGIDWEYGEVDRKTGRPRKVKFAVPIHLDPRDPGDWTNKWGTSDNADGMIVVCHGTPGVNTGDIQFFGDPTPDMFPLDDEAAELSAKFAKQWSYKPEEANVGYSQSLVDRFQSEMAVAQAKPAEVPGMTDLIASMAKLTEAMAAGQQARRV